MAPQYLCDLLQIKEPERDLRSSVEIVLVHRMDLRKLRQPGQRAFMDTSVALWNKLQSYVRNAENMAIFKKRLKTHLFQFCYNIDPSKGGVSQRYCNIRLFSSQWKAHFDLRILKPSMFSERELWESFANTFALPALVDAPNLISQKKKIQIVVDFELPHQDQKHKKTGLKLTFGQYITRKNLKTEKFFLTLMFGSMMLTSKQRIVPQGILNWIRHMNFSSSVHWE